MCKYIHFLLILVFLGSVVLLPAVTYTKNPTRAMLYSTVFPGGGQIYVHSYLKAGIVMGVQGYLLSQAVYHNDRVSHFHQLMDGTSSLDDLHYRHQRDKYRNELRNDEWWIGTTLFLSVADAFVDAHLYNSKQEKQKIHLKFSDKDVQLQYNF